MSNFKNKKRNVIPIEESIEELEIPHPYGRRKAF